MKGSGDVAVKHFCIHPPFSVQLTKDRSPFPKRCSRSGHSGRNMRGGRYSPAVEVVIKTETCPFPEFLKD